MKKKGDEDIFASVLPMWALPFGRRLITAFASICFVMAACGDGVDANDAWANATALSGSEGSVVGCNTNATSETGEPTETNNRSLWWKWTAPDKVTKAAFYTYGSDFDTVLGVYTGTEVASMAKIAVNDDHNRWGGVITGGVEYASLVSFDVTPGTAYYICVAGKDEGACGNIKLGWCASEGFSLVVCDGTLLGFIGDCPETVTIPNTVTKIEQSAFDRDCDDGVVKLKKVVIPQSVTEIGLYAFCKCVNLSSITFNGNLSDIAMDAYWVFYDTPFRAGVNANDAWVNALELSGAEGTVDAWNGFATAETGEPEFTQNHPLWWKWTAPDGMDMVMFHTQGSDFDTVLGVYTGTAVNALTKVAENNDSSGRTSSVSFRVTKGQTYYICVAGNGDRAIGNIKLSWKKQNGNAAEQTVTLDLGGGTGTGTVTVGYGTKVGDIPVPTRANYRFIGWFTAPTGGTRVSDDTEITSDMKLYARWEAISPSENDSEVYYLYENAVDAVPTAAASIYDGYIYDGDKLTGTIQVKVGKRNKRTLLSAVKATVVGLDGRKKNLKAVDKGKASIADGGPTTISFTGGDACEVTLGIYSMKGKYGTYDIDGARNLFMSKNASEKAAAAGVLANWRGAVNAAWAGAHGWNGLSAVIANKGKVKVSGSLADGTKLPSVKSQLLVGENWCCVPVLATRKADLALMLWVPKNRQGTLAPGVVGISEAVVGKPGSLKSGAEFKIDAVAFNAMWGRIALPYLPNGVAVESSGTRWKLPKAGKVVYARGSTEVDTTKLRDNPSALKLTYRAKDGTFKGSFKAYAEVNGKPKATTVNVVGVLVDGVGYGTATIKKVGSLPVTVE